MIIVLAFSLIVSLFVIYLVSYQYWVYNTGTADLSIGNSARTALDDIDNYVRQANRVVQSYSSYTTGAKTLILQIQSVDSSNQLIAGSYDIVVFYLSGSNLIRQVFPYSGSSRLAVTKILSGGVDPNSFSFTYDNADFSLVRQVTINITVQQNVINQTRSITLSSQSKLRDY